MTQWRLQASACSKQQMARGPVSDPDSWEASTNTQGCSLSFVYGPAFTHTNMHTVTRTHTSHTQSKAMGDQGDSEVGTIRRVRIMTAKELGCSEGETKKVNSPQL